MSVDIRRIVHAGHLSVGCGVPALQLAGAFPLRRVMGAFVKSCQKLVVRKVRAPLHNRPS